MQKRPGQLSPRRVGPSTAEPTGHADRMTTISISETHPERPFSRRQVRLRPDSLFWRRRPSVELAKETTNEVKTVSKRAHDGAFDRAARGWAAR